MPNKGLVVAGRGGARYALLNRLPSTWELAWCCRSGPCPRYSPPLNREGRESVHHRNENRGQGPLLLLSINSRVIKAMGFQAMSFNVGIHALQGASFCAHRSRPTLISQLELSSGCLRQQDRVCIIHNMNSKELIKRLEAGGWVLRGVKGSHIYTHPSLPGHLSVPHP